MPKQYKLLKDMPDAKAGTVFTWCDSAMKYLYKSTLPGGIAGSLRARVVEDCDEWFERVLEVHRIVVNTENDSMVTVEFAGGGRTFTCSAEYLRHTLEYSIAQLRSHTTIR